MENKQREAAGFRFSDLSLSCLARQLLRSLWMIAAAALLFGACGWGYNRFVYQPRYQAEVTCAVTRGEGFEGAPEAATLLAGLLNASASSDRIRHHALQPDAAVTAGVIKNTNLILITLEGNSPEDARQLTLTLEVLLPELAGYISGEIETRILHSDVSREPINPQSRLRLCLICAAFGAVGMSIAVCRYCALRRTVQTRCGARRMLAGAILASLPHSRTFSEAAYTDQLTDLCLQIERAHRLRGEQLFLVAGAGKGEGKTTVATNLAKMLAARGRDIVLVEWDSRNSTFTGWFQNASQPSQVLEKLGGKANTPNGAALLEQLRKQFDYIILDTPSMHLYFDAEALAVQADAALLVVRQGHTPVLRIQEASAALQSSGCTFLGYVLNDMTGNGRMGDPNSVPKLDILSLFSGCFRGLRRSWPVFVLPALLVSCLTGALAGWQNAPEYETSAVISVCDGDSGLDAASVKMAAAFPQLIQMGLMEDYLKLRLGVDRISGEISASVVTGTNVVTVKVRSDSSRSASDILNALLEGYPQIAAYTAEKPQILLRQAPSVPAGTNKGLSVAAAAAIGAVIGLAAAAAAVCVHAVLLHPLTDAQQLAEILGVPAVPVEPQAGDESLRTLRLRVEKLCPQANGSVIAVTGMRYSEGTSEISAGLALALAEAGHKVVLVDGNLRHQSLYKQFGGKADGRGLHACLEDQVSSLDVCLKSVGGSRLMYLSGADAGQYVPDSEEFERVLGQLRKRFDYVIVDAPPVGAAADAQVFLHPADCVLYAARQDCSTVFEIREAADRLRERGIVVHACMFCKGSKDCKKA